MIPELTRNCRNDSNSSVFHGDFISNSVAPQDEHLSADVSYSELQYLQHFTMIMRLSMRAAAACRMFFLPVGCLVVVGFEFLQNVARFLGIWWNCVAGLFKGDAAVLVELAFDLSLGFG